MNLHLIPDSGFLNSFIAINEKISPDDVYLISSGPSAFSKPSKKKVTSEKVKVAVYNSKEFRDIIGDIKKYDRVFLHFLHENYCRFILNASRDVNFYWVFWGADLYYPYRYFVNEIYDEDSIHYFKKNNTFSYTKNAFIDRLKKMKRDLLGASYDRKSFELKAEAIEHIRYFLHYNVADFDAMKRNFKTNADHQHFFYFEYDYSALPLVNSISREEKKQYHLTAGKVIQLGNSASLSNNHLSALKLLSRFSKEDIQIICPLSYGDFKYASQVTKLGKEIFGDRFIPLTEFIPKEKYLGLLKCVDILITNHLRTEGAGNVFMMAAMGKKIYCNGKGTLHPYLQKQGMSLLNTDDIKLQSFEEFSQLQSAQEQQLNRKVIIDLFSITKAEENLANIYNLPPDHTN